MSHEGKWVKNYCSISLVQWVNWDHMVIRCDDIIINTLCISNIKGRYLVWNMLLNYHRLVVSCLADEISFFIIVFVGQLGPVNRFPGVFINEVIVNNYSFIIRLRWSTSRAYFTGRMCSSSNIIEIVDVYHLRD